MADRHARSECRGASRENRPDKIGGTPDPAGAGTDADDTLADSDDPNLITAGGGNDTVDAGGGDDIVLAGEGDDSVDGGTGNDTIDGGAGNDTLTGGTGDDTIAGGAGSDTFVHNGAGDGLDTLVDFNRTEDTTTIHMVGAAGEYTFDPVTKALVDAATGTYGFVFGGTSDSPDEVAFAGTEVVFSAGGELRSAEGNLDGTASFDLLLLFGGAANATLRGLDGNDRLLEP